MSTLPQTDDRLKVVPPPVTGSQSKDDRQKVVSNPANTPPPKDDRQKGAPNPMVPLYEAMVAVGPGDVWKKVAESLNPLLQDWQTYAQGQRWDRLAANLAAASTIAAGMALLWERGKKYEADA